MTFLRRCVCALVVATDFARAQGVVINEVHYDPADAAKAVQFVELHNPGAAAVDVSRWSFSNGVKFVFPAVASIAANGFAVLAASTVAFQKEFGFAPAGEFFGALKKRGEKLALSDARGKVVDQIEYGAGFPWPTAARGAGSSMERINPALESALAASWRSSGGSRPTPGAANSVFAPNAPPAIRAVSHMPAQPKSKQAVTVSAAITDPDGVSAVTLEVQFVEPGRYLRKGDPAYATTWVSQPMTDAVGNGYFTAQIPADAQTHRRLVRYRISATDGAGRKVRVPYADDECPNFAYFVYDGAAAWTAAVQPGKTPPLIFPATLMTTLPTFQLLANKDDVERSQWDGGANKHRFSGAFVSDGRVYDHIQFHNRGQASTHVSGKNKWGFKFNRARDFLPPVVGGRSFKKPWDAISMNACASPWVQSNRGMAGLDEAVAFGLYALAGVPSSRTVPVQLRVIDSTDEVSPKSQYDGDAWGLYLVVEEPDGSFLDERGLPDGNVYRIGGGGGDRKHASGAQPADGADWNKFIEASRHRQKEDWWRANLDLGSYYSFHACNRLTGNVDLREGDNHYFYHRPDGRWTPIPWDLDMMFIPKGHQSGRIDQERCLEVPVLKLEYRNRCRELLDLLVGDATPNGGQVGQLVAEYTALVHPAGFPLAWPEFDQCLWNYHPRTNDKGGFYRNPTTGGPDGNWTRKLSTPDFFGFAKYVTEFCTNARPDGGWKQDDGDARGYGYGWLRADAEDAAAPERPTISYVGPAGFPAHALRFQCSLFSDPQGPATFSAMQWRVGEIGGKPLRYEIEPLWTSAELTAFDNQIAVPSGVALRGRTYRARVRMKDDTGRWSRWSEAVTFTAK